MSNPTSIKDILRPVLQTFTRDQLVACFKLAFLPRGDLATPEWIFAVGELNGEDVAILTDAARSLTRQPSRDEITAIITVTREFNGIVNGSTNREGTSTDG